VTEFRYYGLDANFIKSSTNADQDICRETVNLSSRSITMSVHLLTPIIVNNKYYSASSAINGWDMFLKFLHLAPKVSVIV